MAERLKLSAEQNKRLLDYLESEITTAEEDVYEPQQAKREEWEDQYTGKVAPRKEKWMSNVPMLLGATFVDAVTARLMNTMNAYRPTFTVKATRTSDWVPIGKAVEDFMEHKIQTEMDYYNTLRRVIFETCRLGTGVMLAPWVEERETVQVKRFGLFKQSTSVITKQGTVCRGMTIKDLLLPGGYSELEDLPWWSRYKRWSELDIRMMRYDKYIDKEDIELLLKYKTDNPNNYNAEATKAAQVRAGEEEPTIGLVHTQETWIRFDLEKEGEFRKYKVIWHPEASKILRVEVDTYPRWPLFLFRYGPRDYGIYGLGIMEMSNTYETQMYALMNLLIDNYKIATMQCFKGKKGQGLRPDTKIYPGKFFLLDNPADLESFPLGQAYQLNPAFIRTIMDLAERRTGISDYSLGRESPMAGGRATATGTLALIQEGQRRFDLCIRDVRQVLDSFGNFALRMVHENLPPQVPYMLLGERGALIEKWLSLPPSPPYYSIYLTSNLSNVSMNKEVAKSDATTTMGLMTQFYQAGLQLQQMAKQDPQNAATYQAIQTAAAQKFRSVLEVFGEPSPERYSDVFITGVPSSMATPPPGPPGTDMGEGAPAQLPPGMENEFSPELMQAMGGGNGQPPESPNAGGPIPVPGGNQGPVQ